MGRVRVRARVRVRIRYRLLRNEGLWDSNPVASVRVRGLVLIRVRVS